MSGRLFVLSLGVWALTLPPFPARACELPTADFSVSSVQLPTHGRGEVRVSLANNTKWEMSVCLTCRVGETLVWVREEASFLSESTIDTTLLVTCEDADRMVACSADLVFVDRPLCTARVDAQGLVECLAVAVRAVTNPARQGTQFSIEMPSAENVVLRILDLNGREVARPWHGPLGQGTHVVDWDGANRRGQPAPHGVYFYQFQSASGFLTGKLVVLQ